MPLPEESAPFPGPEWAPAFDQFAVNSAWYSGDLGALSAFGDGSTSANRGDDPATHYHNRQPRAGGVVGWWKRNISNAFWGRPVTSDQRRTRVHNMIAGNLAGLSSDLLFAEPSNTRLLTDGKGVKGPAQKRMDLIANSASTQMAYAEGAEFAAGIGAAVLRAEWDRSTSDHPTTGVIACDAAIAEWTGPRTTALNLFSTHYVTDFSGYQSGRYTHVERHEIGAVVHALYYAGVGDNTIGRIVPVAQWAERLEAVAYIPEIPGSIMDGATVILPTGIELLTAQYWRNRRTRLLRSHGTLSRIGRADTEGAEGTLSMIDETWSSWMRDIKIARARLIVPQSMLDVDREGAGGVWDDDAEILSALNYVDLKGGQDDTIQAHQFEIRAAEHKASILEFSLDLLQHTGYSPSSYGIQTEASRTATEVVDRTTQTERTRNKKALYFRQAAIPLNEALMELDRVHYSGQGMPSGAEIDIQFAELSQIDPEKLARTLSGLRAAEAASTKTLVRMQHPEWDDVEIGDEVTLIIAESQGSLADPSTEGRVDPGADPLDPTAGDGNPDDLADVRPETAPAEVAA